MRRALLKESAASGPGVGGGVAIPRAQKGTGPPASTNALAEPEAAEAALPAAVSKDERVLDEEKAKPAGGVEPALAGKNFPELSSNFLTSVEKSADKKRVVVRAVATAGAWPVRVAAPGGRVVWRAGAGGEIEKSADGGATWTPQPSGVSTELLAGTALSEKICWIVGRNGTVLRTTDGERWVKLPFPSHGDLGSVTPTDAHIAVVWVVQEKITYATFDGGNTWMPTGEKE
jgi:hypothetical protein